MNNPIKGKRAKPAYLKTCLLCPLAFYPALPAYIPTLCPTWAEQAAQAYQNAAKRLHKDFARQE